MNFSDELADLDRCIEDHLCDDGVYIAQASGGAGVPVRIMLDQPRLADRLPGMAFTRSRPVLKVARNSCPVLREGDVFLHGSDRWEVAEAPAADGDGAWWAVEVQPG